MIYCKADTKATPALASIFRLILISLLHNVVNRVCNRTARFPCVFGNTDSYGVWKNWMSFTSASRTALGSTQPLIEWLPWAVSLWVMRPGRDADHSPLSSAEVKNAWSYTSTPQYVFMTWCFVKHRDDFTFTFTFVMSDFLFDDTNCIKMEWLILLSLLSVTYKVSSNDDGNIALTYLAPTLNCWGCFPNVVICYRYKWEAFQKILQHR
jgi:hypothetical protein